MVATRMLVAGDVYEKFASLVIVHLESGRERCKAIEALPTPAFLALDLPFPLQEIQRHVLAQP